MSRSWASGSTRRWREVRRTALLANHQKTGGMCQLDVGAHCPRHQRPCPDVCTHLATQVHHDQGRARTGDDPRYLTPACQACNLHVGDPAQASPDPEPRPRTRW